MMEKRRKMQWTRQVIQVKRYIIRVWIAVTKIKLFIGKNEAGHVCYESVLLNGQHIRYIS